MQGVNVPAGITASLQPFGIYLGVIVTFGVWSMLYRENPFYRICEFAYVGSASAHGLVTTFANTIKPGVLTNIIQNGNYWEIIPICLGCLIYFQPFRTKMWIARYPMAYWVGYNAGYALTMRTAMPLLTQIRQTMLPVIVRTANGISLVDSINNILFSLFVLFTMSYFLFSMNVYTGRYSFLLRVARVIMMVAFGAGFGTGVGTRISLLIGRLDFLFSEWLTLY
ncbi:MAG: hypothetical protein FWF06_04485 [Symbiobacteriaceae bacterium]|nr:hypothetical protein [Symbiobacteriaceae bacterium]